MSVYAKDASVNNNHLTQNEVHLYGSSRLGILNVDEDMEVAQQPPVLIRGNKFFELSNHLGNVLVTVSDKKTQVEDGNGNVAYYTADVISANDYYPFGMDMPGRQYNAAIGYRYGFNGKEKDKESPVQYDYGFRIYDPRLARFKSVDPLTSSYPWYTPYQFAGNKPIWAIDIDGLEEYIITTTLFKKGGKQVEIEYVNHKDAKQEKVNMKFRQVMKVDKDGNIQLGDYLTKNKIVRIIQDENGNELDVSYGNRLTKEEISILKKSKPDDSYPPTDNVWTLGANKRNYQSETERNTDIHQDMYASKQYDPLPQLSYNNAAAAINLYGTNVPNNGALDFSVPGGDILKNLPEKIANDGGIRSINITLRVPVNSQLSNDEINNIRVGVYQAGQNLKKHFEKSGVSNINVDASIILTDKKIGGVGNVELKRE